MGIIHWCLESEAQQPGEEDSTGHLVELRVVQQVGSVSVNQGAEGQAILPALAGRKNNRSVAADQLDRAADVHLQHYKHEQVWWLSPFYMNAERRRSG